MLPQETGIERYSVADAGIEISRFRSAIGVAKNELASIFETARVKLGDEDAGIFLAQAAILDDPQFIECVEGDIQEHQGNAETAVTDTLAHFANALQAIDNDYFRARAADLSDVSGRIVRILAGKSVEVIPLSVPSIIVARNLTPSDTVNLDKSLVLGFCTVEGGTTSHTAILARSLGLPAIVGARSEILSVPSGTQAIIDGSKGFMWIDPPEKAVDDCRKEQSYQQSLNQEMKQQCDKPAVTRDGHPVGVVANIGNLESARAALDFGAEGVGLLRSEFLYLERNQLPTEEEQIRAYQEILDTFGQRPVILRTLDIGGDKELPYLGLSPETNPFLGIRAIRLGLKRADLLKPQLRAALQAGVGHNLKIMFPMIAVAEEIRAVRKVFEECKSELALQGIAYADNIEIGIMIEIPSAALMAEQLAREVDFFSIGTNDLTQYTLAADRTNPELAYLTDALNPAVLRLIHHVIKSAHHNNKWVGLCGELAGEPVAIPILLGLGIDELSMNPHTIPLAKEIIRKLSFSKCQEIAYQVDGITSAEEIRNLLQTALPISSSIVPQ
jgi:phosphoenolpyruvate-protein phosphotransferase